MQASLRLAPLSEDEVRFAVAETRRWSGGKQLVFYEIDLLESISTEAKTAVLGGDWEALPQRRARVVAGDPRANLVLVGDVAASKGGGAPNLDTRTGVQPPMASEEYTLVQETVVNYPPFRKACEGRGIAPEHVRIDAWCAGWYTADDNPDRRLAVPIMYLQEKPVPRAARRSNRRTPSHSLLRQRVTACCDRGPSLRPDRRTICTRGRSRAFGSSSTSRRRPPPSSRSSTRRACRCRRPTR